MAASDKDIESVMKELEERANQALSEGPWNLDGGSVRGVNFDDIKTIDDAFKGLVWAIVDSVLHDVSQDALTMFNAIMGWYADALEENGELPVKNIALMSVMTAWLDRMTRYREPRLEFGFMGPGGQPVKFRGLKEMLEYLKSKGVE